MTRELELKNILKTTLTETEIKSFFSYQLTKEDLEFLKEAITEVLRTVPANAFNCAMLSGLLGAIISDHSSIPSAVIAGHLDYSSKRLFNCSKPIPYHKDKTEIKEEWDGHCWVEINNLIVDVSLFRTIYFGQVPEYLFTEIVTKFGKGRGAFLCSDKEMKDFGFNYIPCYCLTNDQISGLVLGAKSIIQTKE
jgi:hypothetical protein